MTVQGRSPSCGVRSLSRRGTSERRAVLKTPSLAVARHLPSPRRPPTSAPCPLPQCGTRAEQPVALYAAQTARPARGECRRPSQTAHRRTHWATALLAAGAGRARQPASHHHGQRALDELLEGLRVRAHHAGREGGVGMRLQAGSASAAPVSPLFPWHPPVPAAASCTRTAQPLLTCSHSAPTAPSTTLWSQLSVTSMLVTSW